MTRMFALLLMLFTISICNGNMIRNSSFEENDGVNAVGYTFDNKAAKIDTSLSHTGKTSIRVESGGSFLTEPIKLNGVVNKQRRIVVSAWAKAEKVIPANQGWKAGRLLVWVKDKDGKGIKVDDSSNLGLMGDFSAAFGGTFEWKKFSGNFVLPSNTASVVIQGALASEYGTAWFDDFSLEEIPLEWAVDEDSSAQITINTSKSYKDPIIGVGWNWEFVWGPPYEMNASDDMINQFMKFAKWDQQSFIRFGYVSQYCMKNDLRRFEPELDDSEYSVFYRKVLSGLKELDITLLACNWFYGDMTTNYADPPYPNDRFVDSAAIVIKNWIDKYGYTNIKYASLWNEPCWSYKGNYPGDFYVYTIAFDKKLKELGIRDKVYVMGSDSTESGAAAEFRFPRYNRIMGDAVDAFAFHDYASEVEAPGKFSSGGTLDEFLKSYKNAAIDLGEKPLFMSEFGSGTKGDEANYRGTLGNAELVIGGLNNGVTAFARWAYNFMWNTSVGNCPFLIEDNKLKPKKPVFYPYSLLTKSIRPGMKSVKCNIDGGFDSAGYKRIHAASVADDNGLFALIIVNDGLAKKIIKINGKPDKKLYHYSYDSSLPDGLIDNKPIDRFTNEVEIKPMSVNALVSWKWDSLKPEY